MTVPLSLSRRIAGIVLAFALLLGVSLSGFSAPAGAATKAAAAPAIDTGKYYVFRTRDTGKPATNEQNKRCNDHFGLRALTTISRLNALLFSYEANPATGRIANQTKSLLGPGFICAVPGLLQKDAADAYAYSSLPGPGLVEAAGSCAVAPLVITNLPVILNCGLKVKPDTAKGIDGGLITSNSLVNTLDRSDTAPTGSVWTANVIGKATNTGGGTAPVPPNIGPETPGLDFFTVRTRDEQVSTSSPECQRAGVANDQLAIRTANLSVAQPDPTSGLVPEVQGPSIGKLVVCYLYASNTGYRVAAVATLKTSKGTFDVKGRGDCRTATTVASPTLRSQACSLTVTGGPVKAGLITSNGLIEAGKPASAANSAVWTFAMFGAPAA